MPSGNWTVCSLKSPSLYILHRQSIYFQPWLPIHKDRWQSYSIPIFSVLFSHDISLISQLSPKQFPSFDTSNPHFSWRNPPTARLPALPPSGQTLPLRIPALASPNLCMECFPIPMMFNSIRFFPEMSIVVFHQLHDVSHVFFHGFSHIFHGFSMVFSHMFHGFSMVFPTCSMVFPWFFHCFSYMFYPTCPPLPPRLPDIPGNVGRANCTKCVGGSSGRPRKRCLARWVKKELAVLWSKKMWDLYWWFLFKIFHHRFFFNHGFCHGFSMVFIIVFVYHGFAIWFYHGFTMAPDGFWRFDSPKKIGGNAAEIRPTRQRVDSPWLAHQARKAHDLEMGGGKHHPELCPEMEVSVTRHDGLTPSHHLFLIGLSN